MTNEIKALPRNVAGLTAAWFTAALDASCPGIIVNEATPGKILWGTTTKIFMELKYAPGAESFGIPELLCIKGEFDEKLRESLSSVTTTGTQIEAQFYNDLAPRLGMPLPRHWYGGSEPGMGILILDDLSRSGTQFGSPTAPWTPDQVAKALPLLARLHGSTWQKTFPELTWLQVGSPAVVQFTEFLQSAAHWDKQFAGTPPYEIPAALRDRARNLDGLRRMWQYDKTHADCLIHGDTHLGNTCITADGAPYFLDWAGPAISHWAIDVGYFIAGAMTVADRRATERDLLAQYLKALAAAGGPQLPWDAAWDEYRRHQLHGLNWAVLPPSMQSAENVQAMGERHCAAIIDLGTLNLLGV